jgi:thiol:disulfide interchange protein
MTVGWAALAVDSPWGWRGRNPIAAPAPSRRACRSAPEAWSEAAVEKYRAESKPLFVYFTADWCLTCKATEGLRSNAGDPRCVQQGGPGWSVTDCGDPRSPSSLESRGRAGVPLYLWYAPGQEPEELPQILTPGMLVERAARGRS